MAKKNPYDINKIWVWYGNAYLMERKCIRHDGLNPPKTRYSLRFDLTVSLAPNTATEQVKFELPIDNKQYHALKKEYIKEALNSKKEPKIEIKEGKLALLLKPGK
jgi:hypothetical protein